MMRAIGLRSFRQLGAARPASAVTRVQVSGLQTTTRSFRTVVNAQSLRINKPRIRCQSTATSVASAATTAYFQRLRDAKPNLLSCPAATTCILDSANLHGPGVHPPEGPVENPWGMDIAVRRSEDNNQLGIWSSRDFQAGEELATLLIGETQPTPDMHSVQLDETHHIPFHHLGPMAYLNHSCEPNCWLRVVKEENGEMRVAVRVVTLAPIKKGQQLTFDYATTEYDMDVKFDCFCGTESCRGHIGGFKHLREAEKPDLIEFCSPYILSKQEA
eukprot:Clim_evm39s2 gene=Clim_evmTU39s2